MKKVENNIVGLGEVTGHYHQLHGDGVAVYDPEDGSGTLLIEAPNGYAITHQEHKEFTVPGNDAGYERRIVREFDPIQESVVNVMD
jgi:hypothetical protein